MNNKAQGRTFWIVVTAVVALVVLIILLIIFTGKTSILEQGLLSCESKVGDCSVDKSSTAKCPSGYTKSTTFTCKDTTKMCCLGVKSS
ncbi:hypothetical protein ACFL0E_00665 [Nanoarchaeota archaeon]